MNRFIDRHAHFNFISFFVAFEVKRTEFVHIMCAIWCANRLVHVTRDFAYLMICVVLNEACECSAHVAVDNCNFFFGGPQIDF